MDVTTVNFVPIALYQLPYIIIGVVGIILALWMRGGRGLVIGAMALLIVQNLLSGGTTIATTTMYPEAMSADMSTTISYVSGGVQVLLTIAMWVLIFIALMRRGSTQPGSVAGPAHPGYHQGSGNFPAPSYGQPSAPPMSQSGQGTPQQQAPYPGQSPQQFPPSGDNPPR